jgi:aspartate aminotransferase-like enzyme
MISVASQEAAMPLHKQRVLDHTGDTVHTFDPENTEAVREAMERFNDLVKNQKHVAYTPNGDGTAKIAKEFDPTATETAFRPQLHGG